MRYEEGVGGKGGGSAHEHHHDYFAPYAENFLPGFLDLMMFAIF
jgi:hypothetical protein